MRSRTGVRPSATWRATRSAPPISLASSRRRRISSSSGSHVMRAAIIARDRSQEFELGASGGFPLIPVFGLKVVGRRRRRKGPYLRDVRDVHEAVVVQVITALVTGNAGIADAVVCGVASLGAEDAAQRGLRPRCPRTHRYSGRARTGRGRQYAPKDKRAGARNTGPGAAGAATAGRSGGSPYRSSEKKKMPGARPPMLSIS